MTGAAGGRGLTRRGFLALAGISAAAATAACAGAPTATTHLRLSSWNIPTDLESYQRIADAFVARHPGTSVAVEVTTGQFHQWFITRLAADLAPDIIRITPQQIGRYAANGSLVDLSDAVPADYRDDYSEAFWAIGARQNGLFGVFQHTDNFITYVNRDIMAEIGVTPPERLEDAWTWDEFAEIATEVRRVTGRYAFGYGWSGPETAYRWLPLVYQGGGGLLGPDGRTPTMDTPEVVDALAFGRRWYAEGLVSPGNLSKSGGGDVARNLFLGGQIGMMLNNPESIAQLDTEMADRWASAPMIRGVAEATDLGGNALAVTRSSRHPELAAELVADLTSRDRMVEFCHDGNWLPARASLDADDIGYASNVDTMQRFIDQGTTTPLELVVAESSERFSSLNTILGDFLDLGLLGQLTPAEAAADMQEAMLRATAI